MYIICISNGKNTINKIHSLLKTDQVFKGRHVNHHNKTIKIKSVIIK